MQIQPENLVSQVPEKHINTEIRKAVQVELAADNLQQFGELRFIAHGSSMLPAIYPGDCLTIKRDIARAPRCGDVVLCLRQGAFLVHRIRTIVERNKMHLYVLRGDALRANDPPVESSAILGQVVSVERRGNAFDPNKRLGMHLRIMAVLIRNFELAARIMVHWNNLRSANFRRKESIAARTGRERAECL